MRIDSLGLPAPAVDLLESHGYETLHPPQEDSIDAGLLDGESVLVSAPTASGKTLIAMLAMLGYFSRGGSKAVYLSPLKALAAEKFAEFKTLFGALPGRKLRVDMSVGDPGSAGRNPARANILILTNERMDSMIRRRAPWLADVGLVVCDETHLIGDPGRGPTLEMVLTHAKRMEPRPQIVCLSATITNSDQIARWLGCRLVENGWRPVPLSEGVCDYGQVEMDDGSTFEVDQTQYGTAVDLGVQSVKEGGQSLIFAETRAKAKSLAAKASKIISKTLGQDESLRLRGISESILQKTENTNLVLELAETVRGGSAFHHAGLSQACRSIIEDEFRAGSIKILASTPTLAAGVNLPARRVVISSIRRYNSRAGGNIPISVLEYKQLCGRAGRPQYDDHGESVVVGNAQGEEIMEKYVRGRPEPIESKLADRATLRTHALSVVVTNPSLDMAGITSFFSQTLAGMQNPEDDLEYEISSSLHMLSCEGLVEEKDGGYVATKFGSLVSMLYIDPVTAISFRDAVGGARQGGMHTVGFLHQVSICPEFYPQMQLRVKDAEAMEELHRRYGQEFLGEVWPDECLRSLLALHRWIMESSERSLSDDLNVESGDMHRMTETAEWLLRCLYDISRHVGRTDLLGELSVLRTRVMYGVKDELADIVRVRQIGRVRARALYSRGVRTLKDLEAMPLRDLAAVAKIGPATARTIKADLRRM